MERSRSYRAERLNDAALAKARERARHVIVLMLENRSFDHLLGLLDHPSPDFENVRTGEHPNPYDLDDPSQAVTVADTGEPRLETDPPHGHVSALIQLHRRVGRFGMDGFVAAYAQKLAGKEHVPRVRWWRVAAPAALLVVPLAAAAHDLARRAVNAGWSGFEPWLAGAGAAVLLGTLLLRLPALPSVRYGRLLAAGALVTAVAALAAEGIARWIDHPRGVVSWTVVTGALMLPAVLQVRRRMAERARVPQRHIRMMSQRIMWCMTPEKLPALAELAREYAVCTRWHSSVPGATWPNRNFVHAATSDESVDIELGFYED
ncbi:MAG: alkaline phosphatase family protein, partial [Candidatus Limnocylindria bacterium]